MIHIVLREAFQVGYSPMDTTLQTPSFIEDFTHAFKPEPFHRLARQTCFCRRQGKIDPFDFLLGLVLAQATALRLTLNTQAQSLEDPVSPQAIHQRYTPEAVAFFHAAHDHVLAEALAHPPTVAMAEALREHFSAVYLLDSTCFDAPPTLQTLFPSCGGDASPANLKVLLRYEYIQGQFEPRALLPGKKSDQGLAAAAAAQLQKDQLQIQDKGFYDAAAWHAAQASGAYLLMPWARSATVWARPQPGQPEQLLDVAAALAVATGARVEWAAVTLGKDQRRVEGVRLTAFRLSPESAARHRQALREAQRRQGRTPTAAALELAGWLILITNAPVAKLPTPMIAYLYRLRWQIELIFRQCKTTLRLDQARGDNEHRTQCQIWARLICATFVFLWHAHANAACWVRHRMEISFEKTACLIQLQAQGLARALFQGGTPLREVLHRLWRCLLKTARKGRQKTRTNSWDALCVLWLDPQPTPQAPIPMNLANH
jgi:hypothetical protein